jgi:hypothetical protein
MMRICRQDFRARLDGGQASECITSWLHDTVNGSRQAMLPVHNVWV